MKTVIRKKSFLLVLVAAAAVLLAACTPSQNLIEQHAVARTHKVVTGVTVAPGSPDCDMNDLGSGSWSGTCSVGGNNYSVASYYSQNSIGYTYVYLNGTQRAACGIVKNGSTWNIQYCTYAG